MSNFGGALKKAWKKTTFVLKDNAPEIFMAGGIFLGVATVGIAIYETVKGVPVIEDDIETIQDVRESKNAEVVNPSEDEVFDVVAYRKQLAASYVQLGKDVILIYWPAMVAGTTSIVLVLASHGQMKKKNAALVAACNALEQSFKEYRKRVAEKYGEDEERKIRLGLKDVEVKEIGEDGEEKTTVSEEVTANDLYSFQFNQFTSRLWDRDPEMNDILFDQAEVALNRDYNMGIPVWLNDALDTLGMERVKYGYRAGNLKDETWNEKHPDRPIDSKITISKQTCVVPCSMYPECPPTPSGYIPSVCLTFNCDGDITDRVYGKDNKVNKEIHRKHVLSCVGDRRPFHR